MAFGSPSGSLSWPVAYGGRKAGRSVWVLPQREVGVALFFFIGGFVVADPFLTKPRKEWKVTQLYWRSLLRIYPPDLVVLTGRCIVLAMYHNLLEPA